MNENEFNKQMSERFKQIFPDPSTARKMVDLVVSPKPRGWSRKSNAPYYKEVYAQQMKAEIDRMIEENGMLVYRWDEFCNAETGMTPNSLYTRINQSIRFLIEHMDDDNLKYQKWYDRVRIDRTNKVALIIRFIVGMDSKPFKGEVVKAEPKSEETAPPAEEQPIIPIEAKAEVMEEKHMPQWRDRLERWIESKDTNPFVETGLLLSPEEIGQLELEFSQCPSLLAVVRSSEIKVVKVNAV